MASRQIHFLLTLRTQLKLFHWQTHRYSGHVALDGVVEALDDKIDKFVEVYIGKYGRPKMTGAIELRNYSKTFLLKFVKAGIEVLTKFGIKAQDTDLQNIRDEMLAELNKLLYLLTLR